MNKRLKELGMNAGLYVDFNGEPWPKNMSSNEAELAYAQFSELVIRHTIQIMKLNTVKNRSIYTTYDQSLSDGVLELCEQAILDHWDLKKHHETTAFKPKLKTS